MKMPNDDFLEPLRKRPNMTPRGDFETSLHDKVFAEVNRRRSTATWKFRLGVVAVLLLLMIINPLELVTNNHADESSVSESFPNYGLQNTIVEKTDKQDMLEEYPSLKTMNETFINFGVPVESTDVFINYQYGLLTNDLFLLKQFGFFSEYDKDEITEKILQYYNENVNLSTLLITNIERSLGEPEYFVTAQYKSTTGELIEIIYILANNGELVFDPIKNINQYFVLVKIIETNGVIVRVPYFQGQLKGIGESNSVDLLNTSIQNKAMTSSYNNNLKLYGDVTGKIIYDIDSLLSVEFEIEWSSEEMAHPFSTSTFLTFDLAKGQVMHLNDFVLDEDVSKLEETIKNLVITEAIVENPNSLTITKDHSFYLSISDGNIVLYYPRNTLSNMSEVRIHPTLGVLN